MVPQEPEWKGPRHHLPMVRQR